MYSENGFGMAGEKEFVTVEFEGRLALVLGRTLERKPPRLAVGTDDGPVCGIAFADAVAIRDFLDRYIDDAEERP